ncbi:MAG: hypothetical protein M3128_04320 [Verrucomicrobiota bacterium]|nr:hypothetical protein [Verrucomicrobiota bacterium]
MLDLYFFSSINDQGTRQTYNRLNPDYWDRSFPRYKSLGTLRGAETWF